MPTLLRARHCVVLAALVAAVVPPSRLAAQALPVRPVERLTLPNGLTVLMQRDTTVPLVAVNVWYRVGSGSEQPGRTGFAHLFEHIMFMGSENVPVGKFDQWLEAAGGNNNGSTTQDRTNYYEWMPSNALPLALWLEADRMGRLLPTMDQAKLDLQRNVVKNERRQSVDNVPYGRADETIFAALFPPSHPYSWDVIGSMADLSAASLGDVRQFFRTYYAPNNATLAIVGDFQADSVRALVTRYFGAIPRGPVTPPAPVVPPVTLARDTFLVLEDRVQLPRLYDTWQTVKAFTPDDAPLEMLAYVLAGDENSRLYKRLVYDLQVAQDVDAEQNGARLDGWFQVTVTPKPGQTPARMAELVNTEIARVVRDGVTPRELERAQRQARARLLDQLASDLGKSDLFSYYAYFAGTPEFASQDAQRYAAVTTADVERVAATYLTKPRVVLTVVPEGKTNLMVGADR